MLYNIKNKKAFTLVELIIVVTIIAILATVAFMSFGDYPSQARDSVRKADIKNIEKSLQLYETKTGEYPEPDINTEGEKIFGETAYKKVGSLSILSKDPATEKEYFYEKLGKGYYLKANLENGEELEIFGGELPENCKEILKIDNSLLSGNYKIFPKNKKIEVYCDMETVDENGEKGWTRYLDIKGNYSFEEAKKCWLGEIISNENLNCFNPNRFEMRAEKFMLKQGGQKYFYNNPKPEPRVDVKSGLLSWKCLGGTNYMTIMGGANGPYPKVDASNSYFVRLGLNFCIYDRQVGGLTNVWKMNYSKNGSFGPRAGSRETTVKVAEIYIK